MRYNQLQLTKDTVHSEGEIGREDAGSVILDKRGYDYGIVRSCLVVLIDRVYQKSGITKVLRVVACASIPYIHAAVCV